VTLEQLARLLEDLVNELRILNELLMRELGKPR
jgi:hypothetical protein